MTNIEMPHSREAEESVIGSVLINPDALIEDNLISLIVQKDFYIHRNGWIWAAFIRLYNAHTPIDLLTVSEELEKHNQFQEIGGSAYLTSLINQVPTSLNVLAYAHIVKEHSERRMAITIANEIASYAYNGKEEFDLNKVLAKHSKPALLKSRVLPHEAFYKMVEDVNSQDFLTTGLRGLDKKIGGLFKRELSIWGAYEATGKSTWMMQAAKTNAINKKRVTICSLEMSSSQIWLRLACGLLEVDPNSVRSNNVTREVRDQVFDKAEQLADKYKDDWIIYDGRMGLHDLVQVAKYEKPDIFFVDTLGSVRGNNKNSLTDWYNDVLETLRYEVAKDKDNPCHVAVLHHLTRPNKNMKPQRPNKHELKYAGEKDADLVIIPYKVDPDLKPKDEFTPVYEQYIEFLIEKSRFGFIGTHKARLRLKSQSFYSLKDKAQQANFMPTPSVLDQVEA